MFAEWNVHDSSERTDVLTRVTPFQSTDLLQYDLLLLTKCRDPPAVAKQITQMTLMLYGSRPGRSASTMGLPYWEPEANRPPRSV